MGTGRRLRSKVPRLIKNFRPKAKMHLSKKSPKAYPVEEKIAAGSKIIQSYSQQKIVDTFLLNLSEKAKN